MKNDWQGNVAKWEKEKERRSDGGRAKGRGERDSENSKTHKEISKTAKDINN